VSADITGAILARLRSTLPADVTVYDLTVGVNPPLRYVVLEGDVGRRSASSVDGESRDRAFTVQTMTVVTRPYVASDCRWLLSAVCDALTDWRPDDAAGQLVHEVSRRPVDDESVPDRHVTFAVAQFSLLASL
jgi:hypothetical protein